VSYKKNKLDALADIFQSESLEGNIVSLKIKQIKPAENQPRKNKLDRISELAQSIRKDGLLQPIIVTKRDDFYSIIAGERRYHAVKSLGIKEIAAKSNSRLYSSVSILSFNTSAISLNISLLLGGCNMPRSTLLQLLGSILVNLQNSLKEILFVILKFWIYSPNVFIIIVLWL